MLSGSSRKFWIVTILTLVFVLFVGRTASGITTTPPGSSDRGHEAAAPSQAPTQAAMPVGSQAEARIRLAEGFQKILEFFAERDFSLLSAWREMRTSGDPGFFERRYPAISKELDTWAGSLARMDVSEASVGRLDFTFMLEQLGPVALDTSTSEIRRDNALLTICMVCMMDDLRCDPTRFHRFLATVVAEDPSAARKAEALKWWRSTEGFIDEGLLERVLRSPAGTDFELRSQIARALFAIGTPRSLQAQRLLASTVGLAIDPTGAQEQIACNAIRNIAGARFEEATPSLIAALRDPSREVRTCAAESLEVLSGRDFGFDPAIDSPSNLEAIARWRAWWHERASDSAGAAR